jgi:tetratricopeptide (TPR) repeat protein
MRALWGVVLLCVAAPASAQEPLPSDAPAPGASAEQAPAQADTEAAQQAEQDKAMQLMDDEARQHFQIGKTLYDAGRFKDAAREFDEAYRKSGRPQLLYNLYVAHRDDGNWVLAVESLGAYLDKVPDAPDRINLRARLESMQAAAKAQAEREQASAEGEAGPPPKESGTRVEVSRSLWPYVIMGVGGAMLAGGAVTGILTASQTDELDEVCSDGRCPGSEQDNIDSAKTLAITTDVLLFGGAAVLGTGLVLFLTGALDEEREVPMAMGCDGRACAATWTRRF